MLFQGDGTFCAVKFGSLRPNGAGFRAALGCGHINANEPDVCLKTKRAVASNRSHKSRPVRTHSDASCRLFICSCFSLMLFL